MLFIQQLSGFIKGLRANKDDERKFIESVLDEIKVEIRNSDIDIKSTAILKLTYIEMLGFDISWSAFPIIETASSSKAHLKAIGYLAANQSFNSQTEVMMLMPNLLKKDLQSEPGLALTSFTSIATPELSVDLASDISRLTTHTKPSVRQKSVAAILKSITLTNDFELADFKKRLRERLNDQDPGVIVATVSAITELATSYPTQCLHFAPSLYRLLTSSTNNWLVIKVLKLFATLLPYEPRLQRKLFSPINELIENTTAVSVLYECVLTCIIGGMLSTGDLAEKCLEKLTQFLDEEDQNLKYVSLLAIAQMVPHHAHLLYEHEDALLSTLDDVDTLIRLRGLEILSAIVTKSNVERVMNKLFEQLLPTQTSAKDALTGGTKSTPKNYIRQLAQEIIKICKKDHYTNIPSFSWLINVIMQLAKVVPPSRGSEGIDELGEEFSQLLVDIAVNYPQTRQYATNVMQDMLVEYVETDIPVSMVSDLLPAAVYITGEYAMQVTSSQFLEAAQPTIQQLIHPKFLETSHFVMGLTVISIARVYGIHAMLVANGWEDDIRDRQTKLTELTNLTSETRDGIIAYTTIADVEVKERARQLLNLLNVVYGDLIKDQDSNECPKSLYLVSSIYFNKALEVKEDEEMVKFDLNVPLFVNIDEESYTDDEPEIKPQENKEERRHSTKLRQEAPEERAERKRRKAALKAERDANPYYIKSKKDKGTDSDDLDDVPVVNLDIDGNASSGNSTPLFYPKTSSGTSSLKSASTQNLEPTAIESGSISKVVKKKSRSRKV
ncbi:ARM repeat-containing protein [Wallemia mellicola]|nr:ARM repeat-containing protein [Wallemia mellicola]